MTKTTDARRQARAANDRAIQRFHERAHDRERATRRLAILDFRVKPDARIRAGPPRK
ncbi:hypothetical protein KEH58_20900 [Burkholderia cenocepacia]|nr:hypothetical protein KEH58_20900 [Burkholderia cenocepacia]